MEVVLASLCVGALLCGVLYLHGTSLFDGDVFRTFCLDPVTLP